MDEHLEVFHTGASLQHQLQTIQELATRGSWRAVVDSISRARSLSLRKPHEHLVYLTFNVVALIKLRRFTDAAAEFESLESLDSDVYQYQSYPQHYGTLTGSMVPFALRYIYAGLPQHLGDRSETLDRFYSLLAFVRGKLQNGGAERDSVWRKREIFTISSIISFHLNNKEFSVSLQWISELVRLNPTDPDVLCKLGHVQLQIGDVDGARMTFERIERLTSGSSDIKVMSLVNRNRALIYVVGKDYGSAVREYERCIERDGTDVVAINNKALCLLYMRDLSGSIKVLEGALERAPTAALNETLVINLCSMYELAYVNHSDIKQTLSNWIAQVAPDDFDTSCTRI